MKWLVLLLFTFSFGLLAAAGPDPDACGDEVMPPPVDKISCGDSLSDLGCKWYSDFISCIQTCRHQKGLNRLIYHNHRYYDISVEEYDKIMDAEAKASASKSTVKTKATKKAGASSTGKKSGFKTVTRTITHVARQPSVEAEVAGTQDFSTLFRTVTPTAAAQTSDLDATQTSSDSWSTSTKAIKPSATRAAEPEDEDEDEDGDEPHHPRLDFYCQKTSQVIKCRAKCGIHIFGGFPKCMKKCHAKCHKKHPVHPDGEDLALVKRDGTETFSTSWRIAAPTVTKAIQPSATEDVESEDEEPHHPRIDCYCSKETQMYKCRQRCAHHDFIFGIGKKKCEHKCHERCLNKHPLFPDGNGPGLAKRADNETVTDAALEQAIDTVIDTAMDTILNQTSVLANTTNLHLKVERSEGHTPHCSSDNVIMGCKALAQLWAPAYDTIFKKCIKRCIRRHGVD